MTKSMKTENKCIFLSSGLQCPNVQVLLDEGPLKLKHNKIAPLILKGFNLNTIILQQNPANITY